MDLYSMCRLFSLALLCCAAFFSSTGIGDEPKMAAPLVIGETFTLDSKVLSETRRINVHLPPSYSASGDLRLPVLYMPDGGLKEDFLHIAGLVQVLMGNGSMRPHVLVGIENTERRRDLTGPTDVHEDKKLAPRVGGSAAFRQFIREELMPEIRNRYRTTKEAAIVGESLAGLFVVETLALEPELFDTYIAIDPSLWWNDQHLVKRAVVRLKGHSKLKKTLFLSNSGEKELAAIASGFAAELQKNASNQVELHYEPMPEEQHSTIFHPAALKAFRLVFAVKKVDENK
jgi:uncharacterized protein